MNILDEFSAESHEQPTAHVDTEKLEPNLQDNPEVDEKPTTGEPKNTDPATASVDMTVPGKPSDNAVEGKTPKPAFESTEADEDVVVDLGIKTPTALVEAGKVEDAAAVAMDIEAVEVADEAFEDIIKTHKIPLSTVQELRARVIKHSVSVATEDSETTTVEDEATKGFVNATNQYISSLGLSFGSGAAVSANAKLVLDALKKRWVDIDSNHESPRITIRNITRLTRFDSCVAFSTPDIAYLGAVIKTLIENIHNRIGAIHDGLFAALINYGQTSDLTDLKAHLERVLGLVGELCGSVESIDDEEAIVSRVLPGNIKTIQLTAKKVTGETLEQVMDSFRRYLTVSIVDAATGTPTLEETLLVPSAAALGELITEVGSVARSLEVIANGGLATLVKERMNEAHVRFPEGEGASRRLYREFVKSMMALVAPFNFMVGHLAGIVSDETELLQLAVTETEKAAARCQSEEPAK